MVALIIYIAKTLGIYSMCLRIARNIHNILFNRVSRAYMYFFNTNSSGDLLNTFAKDINVIDSSLLQSYNTVFTVSIGILAAGHNVLDIIFSDTYLNFSIESFDAINRT